jgi:hypothetical protein
MFNYLLPSTYTVIFDSTFFPVDTISPGKYKKCPQIISPPESERYIYRSTTLVADRDLAFYLSADPDPRLVATSLVDLILYLTRYW